MFIKHSILASHFIIKQYFSRRNFISLQFPPIRQLLNARTNYHNTFSKFGKTNYADEDPTEDRLLSEVLDENDGDFKELHSRVFHLPHMGHQVIVVLPHVKWGPKKLVSTTPELQLEEATSLINTLSNWKVVGQLKFSMKSLQNILIFGKGQRETIRDLIIRNNRITAMFISINMLKPYQHLELEKEFGIPIYDRHLIVMQIFRQHAISQEAKLQIKLAEIPYLWSRIGRNSMINLGEREESSLELREQILDDKERKLKKAIAILRKRRKLLRVGRNKMDLPVIAVVGYTNAGKTSLIKSLTGSQKLIPKNQLFATLDVTLHPGLLPSRIKVLYVDTIGFISEIPTTLIESFTVTLEDAMLADIIIHVRDISHPDTDHQSNKVLDTLLSLNLRPELLDNIITVGNKVDKINCDKDKFNKDISLISTVTNEGLSELAAKIEQLVFKVCDKIKLKIRVLSGGEESRWLSKEAVVLDQEADPNNLQYTFLNVIISKVSLDKFKEYFIKRK